MINPYLVLGLLIDLFRQVMREFEPQSPILRDELDYASAVKLLVRHQPKTAFIGAVLLRKQEPDGQFLVRAVYLDGDNQPIREGNGRLAGYTIRARTLDSELNDTFGTADLVVWQ